MCIRDRYDSAQKKYELSDTIESTEDSIIVDLSLIHIYIKILEKYLGKDTIDVVVASNTKIDNKILKKYETEEQKDPVIIDYDNLNLENLELIEADLLTTIDNTIRHNSCLLYTSKHYHDKTSRNDV